MCHSFSLLTPSERARYSDEIKSLDQPVFVQNLYVHPAEITRRFGEHTNFTSPYPHIDRLKRITDCIEIMASIANEIHAVDNIAFDHEGKPHVKERRQRCITRLLFYEFSFYTKGTPLSFAEYDDLITKITTIAKNCHENLHLLLSSTPAHDNDGHLFNMTIHVQCGAHPRIKDFAKKCSSKIDLVYKDYAPLKNAYTYSGTPVVYNKHSITHASYALSYIANRPAFIDFFAVCIDFKYYHFTHCADDYIETFPALSPSSVLCTLTSNIKTAREKTQIIGKHFCHADPVLKGNYTVSAIEAKTIGTATEQRITQEGQVPFAECKLPSTPLCRIETSNRKTYPALSIQIKRAGIAISNLPFGPDCRISIASPFVLDSFDKERQEKIEARNRRHFALFPERKTEQPRKEAVVKKPRDSRRTYSPA